MLATFFKTLESRKVTDLVLVPHTLRRLLRMLDGASQYSIQDLQCFSSSSDFLTAEFLENLFRNNSRLAIFNVYGLTEAGRACYRRITTSDPFSASIGGPSPGVEIILEGTPEEPGEIVIRGPVVMSGYFAGIVKDRISCEPCIEVATGDLGYYDTNGEIILVGRRDHMINLMGSKIHPAEIEAVAMQLPEVEDARALESRENDKPTIRLEVICSGSDVSLELLRRHLRRNLDHLFVPTTINRVASIARTEIGSKTLR